jgi:hypothetical protein
VLASEVLIWEQGGRLYARLATNLGRDRFLARLHRLGLEGRVQAVEAWPDATRLEGGNAFIILWMPGTDRGQVLDALIRF